MLSTQEKKEEKKLYPQRVIDFLEARNKREEEDNKDPFPDLPKNWFTWMPGDWDRMHRGRYPFNIHLCSLLGVKEYILLRVLHDITSDMMDNTMDEDRWNWARLSYKQWEELVGGIWKERTIRRVLYDLYLEGLVLRKADDHPMDRVYSWRVNYEHPSLNKDIDREDDDDC